MTRIACVPSRPFSLLFVAALALPLAAQMQPGPAAELQKLARLVGDWHGEGSATFGPGAPPVAWEGHGTYRWSHDGHFVEEDFVVHFAGGPQPMVLRTWLGWDRENRRYVNAVTSNGGDVQLQPIALLEDGSLQSINLQSQDDMRYAERSTFKVDGDTLTHSIEMLMPSGSSMTVVQAVFKRGGKPFAGAFDTPMFEGKKADAMIERLGKSAGTYAVQGEMVMAPEVPAMKITGTDVVRSVWGGSVVHVHTDGEAEGMPGKYAAEVMWGFDAARNCLTAVFLSNMGEVGTMDAVFAADGRLVATSNANFMGQPMVQRMLMTFDDRGAVKSAVAHAIMGTGDPFQNFRASYTRK